MKFKSTAEATEHLHLFLYGDGGCGKTKAIGDFHLAGFPVVLVSVDSDGAIPLRMRGIAAPQIIPENYDEILACVLQHEQVLEKVIRKMPGFADYEPGCWAFDGLRELQRVVLGYSSTDQRTVLEGVDLPATEGHGVMSLPAARPAVGIPSNKDYRVLDDRMRNLVAAIEKMPYHTIITAHYEKDFDIETTMSLTGDAKTDKDVTRRFQGYPALDGFSLKYNLPNLCSSFYLYLQDKNGQYEIQTRNSMQAKARTRIAEVMPPTLPWKDQNLFHLLQKKMEEAERYNANKNK